MYFTIKDHPDETGFVYKIFGYDLSAIGGNLEYVDIDSLFFGKDFPPKDHVITKQFPRHHLFYRDTNNFNFSAIRQEGWFIHQTKDYRGDFIHGMVKPFDVTPNDKKELREFYRINNLDHDFYFPDIKNIARTIS